MIFFSHKLNRYALKYRNTVSITLTNVFSTKTDTVNAVAWIWHGNLPVNLACIV